MANHNDKIDLVRLSRAGDAFHYRWAARRCLKMINPKSLIESITIEGSNYTKRSGEYVIDVAEYYKNDKVIYYQLKHSIQQIDDPFNPSDLRGTIEGFAERFKDENENLNKIQSFVILTNRPFSKYFKGNLEKLISNDQKLDKRFFNTVKQYSGLDGECLKNFCSLLELIDSEKDYLNQRFHLQEEISELIAGVVGNSQVDTIIEMVAEKALPNDTNKITREDVLKRFGVTSTFELFPAQPEFEPLEKGIQRKQHDYFSTLITKSNQPILIQAEGGTGKSVFCRQLASSLQVSHKCIVYDCFGGGKYRTFSEPRHVFSAALVQMANELATMGLCQVLLRTNSDLDDNLLRAFKNRLKDAISSLRKLNEESQIIIFVDAADNAEMAAQEFGNRSFAKYLLQEQMPEGIKLVMLCRPERTKLLSPQSSVKIENLLPFDEDETLAHLNNYFTDISTQENLEFLKLTSGNPRVQANALSLKASNGFDEVLSSLGPNPVNLDDQIANQLDLAVVKLKESLPNSDHECIDNICRGLANLPPFIPINVLSKASGVPEESIRSFVSDLGRPLWLSNNSVQFRDEPTETWFKNTYAATRNHIESFINNLKPLAASITYVSEALPTLLLQAEKYNELVDLALSDKLLPENNPIDARNICIYRLQSAFKAALKQNMISDAVKIAMRAGEEVCGEERQLDLLKNNVDLIGPLQSIQRVQELAFKNLLNGSWEGSENIYSASLLSTVPELKGEARAYFRAAQSWLRIFFEERDKKQKDDISRFTEDNLSDQEVIEYLHSVYRIFGVKKFLEVVIVWTPKSIIFETVRSLIKRLIDSSKFDEVELILSNLPAKSNFYSYLCLGIINELWDIRRVAPIKVVKKCLKVLIDSKERIDLGVNYLGDQSCLNEVLSFLEVCIAHKISKPNIKKLLWKYNLINNPQRLGDSSWRDKRYNFLRFVSINTILSGESSVDIDGLLPKKWLEEQKKKHSSSELDSFRNFVGKLLPWHIFRMEIIAKNEVSENSIKLLKNLSNQAYHGANLVKFEVNRLKLEIVGLQNFYKNNLFVHSVFEELKKQQAGYALNDMIYLLRLLVRNNQLSEMQDFLEQKCYQIIVGSKDDGPEVIADEFISLARAVLLYEHNALTYFDLAIERVSHLGEEMIERWEAIVSIAKMSGESENHSSKRAYRFIRSAELIGEKVAREKYIDRDSAIQVCGAISPCTAIAALSRWRDRNVGDFQYQLFALIRSLLNTNKITPSIAYSFTAFNDVYDYSSLVFSCLNKEKDVLKQEYMLNDAVDCFLKKNLFDKLKTLKEEAKKHSINNDILDQANQHFSRCLNESKENSYSYSENTFDWEEIFKEISLKSIDGINELVLHFRKDSVPYDQNLLWEEFYKRITFRDIHVFLDNLTESEIIDFYGAEAAIVNFPSNWLDRISIQRIWPGFIRGIARKYAISLSSYYRFSNFIKHIGKDLKNEVYNGVFEGLANSSGSLSSESFFSFARFAIKNISTDDAEVILDYSLSRLEKNIDDELGDGPWSSKFECSTDVSYALTGLIWSALGAPEASTRWEATHCVRKLAELRCINEIDLLIKHLNREIVDLFGSAKNPFYYLHSKLYLLIAFSRISIDDASLFQKHHSLFCKIALKETSHALIQKYASEIALRIDKQFPKLISNDTKGELKKVGVSPYPIVKIDIYKEPQSSPWHLQNSVDLTPNYSISYDFSQYWYEPLARVFGIPKKQVNELILDVIKNDLNVDADKEFIQDPRQILRRYSHGRDKTHHSHGSYPEVDNYDFYIQYHAMLILAGKLLQSMPVTYSQWDENKWDEWIEHHLPTRKDGKWLADRRDPPPFEKRSWLKEKLYDDWEEDISEEDYIMGLLKSDNNELWLNVYGNWNECDSNRKESYFVTSALISPNTSESLLYALSTCSDSNDYKLPHYQESRMEINEELFRLTGWIVYSEYYERLDKFDPHAANIYYPPYSFGNEIQETLNMTSDQEQRNWYNSDDLTKIVAKSRIWSQGRDTEREEFIRKGNRLTCSLEFLKELCNTMKRDLIIEIQIKRLRNHYDERKGYRSADSKIFILSGNGILRSAEKSYKLGKKNC